MFVIGDVHGCRQTLKELLAILPLAPTSTIIFVGDLVGKGPDSKGVVDTIIELEKNYEVICLMGNHDSRFLDSLGWNSGDVFGMELLYEGALHLENGGLETFRSYQDNYTPGDPPVEIPDSHRKFFSSLRLYHRTEGYIFVHAGFSRKALKSGSVESALEIDLKEPRTMMWERETVRTKHTLGVTIVHGHVNHNRLVLNRAGKINLDTGCGWGRCLTAIHLPQEHIYSVPCRDKITSTSNSD